jgi:hypothetical protein
MIIWQLASTIAAEILWSKQWQHFEGKRKVWFPRILGEQQITKKPEMIDKTRTKTS